MGKESKRPPELVYSQAARYCVLFVSKSYASKVWTNHERKSAQERALCQHEEYILPVIFDDTRLPGLPATISYVDARVTSPEELAQLICEKIGPITRTTYRGGGPQGNDGVTSDWFEEELISINAEVDGYARALMLVELASRTPAGDQRRKMLFKEAIRAAHSITDRGARACALAEISPCLEMEQRQQALKSALICIRSLTRDQDRLQRLVAVASHLDGEHLDQALEIAHGLNGDVRLDALIGIAPYLKDHNHENRRSQRVKALHIASEINNEVQRCHAVEGLVPYLDRDQLDEVLKNAYQFANDFSRASLLGRLAPYLDHDQCGQALVIACAIPIESARADAFAWLGPRLDREQLVIAMAAAHKMKERSPRQQAVDALTPLASQQP